MSTNGTLSKPEFPANAASKEYAASLDAADPLAGFREKFIIPSKANIASTKLAKPGKYDFSPDSRSSSLTSSSCLSSEPCIYFCGNSLGIQPQATQTYVQALLDTWSSIGVCGHFTKIEDSPLKEWQNLAEQAAESMSKIVGAAPEEVAAMGTLTMNLHLLLASFYKPTATKRKILMDWKAFPSDHVS
jgi:kynureninase